MSKSKARIILEQKVNAAIWENPAPAFRCEFGTARGGYASNLKGTEYDEAGKIRIWYGGGNVLVFYNGSSRPPKSLAVPYLADYVFNASENETLRELAKMYNIPLEFSEDEKKEIRREELAQLIAADLTAALMENPEGEAAQYIKGRGLELGPHFGELSDSSIKRVKDSLKARGVYYTEKDLTALGITEERAAAGYNCVIPYFSDGYVLGFIYRNLRTNEESEKYRYALKGRRGFCEKLTPREPAVIVEGQFDALILQQIGVKNVIAMGGSEMGEELAQLLYNKGIREITYIPDMVTDAFGLVKTKLAEDAVNAFYNASVDGEPVITRLLVLDLPAPATANTKIDAASFGKDNPEELAGMVEMEPIEAWKWRLNNVLKNIKDGQTEGKRAAAYAQDAATAVYNAENNPFERGLMRSYVDKCEDLAAYGVTAEALEDLDANRRRTEYVNSIKAAAGDLNKELKGEINPVKIAAIVKSLQAAQSTNTRAEWERQINATFAEDMAEIAAQPDALQSGWTLGTLDKNGRYIEGEPIEFFPADICLFSALTSHGKTTILFQSAFNVLREHPNKSVLFVSCELNKRQLMERAINLFAEIGETETGAEGDKKGAPQCFLKRTRKRTMKAILRGLPAPDRYETHTEEGRRSYEQLKARVTEETERFGRELWPRLRFVHTQATIESICSNIEYYVSEERAKGADVAAVFIDYAQLLTADNEGQPRNIELKDICKTLKDYAARLELPFILAAQLNRAAGVKGNSNGGAIDYITIANLAEAADLERIAHDIYFIWDIAKTNKQEYIQEAKSSLLAEQKEYIGKISPYKIGAGLRSARIFCRILADKDGGDNSEEFDIKKGYLYIEQLKARDGVPNGWGLLPFNGERGTIGKNDIKAMETKI